MFFGEPKWFFYGIKAKIHFSNLWCSHIMCNSVKHDIRFRCKATIMRNIKRERNSVNCAVQVNYHIGPMDIMARVQTWCVFSRSSLDHAKVKLYNTMRFSEKCLNSAQNSATNPKCLCLYKFKTIWNNSNAKEAFQSTNLHLYEYLPWSYY